MVDLISADETWGSVRGKLNLRANAFSLVKRKLALGKTATVLVIGDSTGNASPEWPFLFGPEVTARFPVCSSRIKTFVSGAYEAAWTNLSTGSGSQMLNIWNMSVSGAQTFYCMGSLFAAAVQRIDPDVIIINHGHNHNSTTIPTTRGAFLALIETLRLYHPTIPIAWFKQNPKQDNDTMAAIMAILDEIAAARDITLIDAYSAFIAAGKALALYDGDSTHPSAAGQLLFRTALMAEFDAASTVLLPAPVPSLFAVPIRQDANLLANGDFAKWTTNPGAPDSWTKFGAGTMTPEKETAVVTDTFRLYSVEMLGTGGASGISQGITGAALAAVKGKKVSLTAKRFVDAASSTASLGKITMSSASVALGTVSAEISSYITVQTGWVQWSISGFDVPEDATTLEIRLYHDNAAAPSTSPAYFDQAALVLGILPATAR